MARMEIEGYRLKLGVDGVVSLPDAEGMVVGQVMRDPESKTWVARVADPPRRPRLVGGIRLRHDRHPVARGQPPILELGTVMDETFWRGFLTTLKQRGLTGVRLVSTPDS